MSDPDAREHTVTLPLRDWAYVVAGLVMLAEQITGMPSSERDEYRRVGRAIAETCPEDSTAWWGAALFKP